MRNRRNRGFVASVNSGIEAAGTHDVVLLNSDTEVPPGWLAGSPGTPMRRRAWPRLAVLQQRHDLQLSGHRGRTARVRPRRGRTGRGLPRSQCRPQRRSADHGRLLHVIRRAALADIGPFDTETFGRGYGEENDFCLRASARGWRHLLACDTFVYHGGSVSFGAGAWPPRAAWRYCANTIRATRDGGQHVNSVPPARSVSR